MNSDSPDRNSAWFPQDLPWVLALTFGALPLLPLFILAERAKQGDPTLLWLGLLSGTIGAFLLCLAKLPLYRQKVFCSFGPSSLPASHRRIYRWAYAGIVGGALCLAGVIAALG